MAGAYVTQEWGIDGSLRVREGESSGVVTLPKLMIGYQYEGSPSVQKTVFERGLAERSGSSLSSLNDSLSQAFTVERYLPFARIERGYASGSGEANEGAFGVSFVLKSQFFNVSEWLHTSENPEMQLGPAKLRIVVDQPEKKRNARARAANGVGSVAPVGESVAPREKTDGRREPDHLRRLKQKRIKKSLFRDPRKWGRGARRDCSPLETLSPRRRRGQQTG